MNKTVEELTDLELTAAIDQLHTQIARCNSELSLIRGEANKRMQPEEQEE